VEANPDLRRAPGSIPVCFDDILDALRTLDRQAAQCEPVSHYRRVFERRNSTAPRPNNRRSGESGDQGSLLN
jgi:nitrate reductase assembly molybdenum cofactor insertion protein NarJ